MNQYQPQQVFGNPQPNKKALFKSQSSEKTGNRILASERISEASSPRINIPQQQSIEGNVVVVDICRNGNPAQLEVVGRYI
jgi:hypothetical protein